MTNNFYMNEIEKIPLLTKEEEKALATKAFSGDKKAQNKLVMSNLRFVIKIANSFNVQDTEDLITEGILGLMKAAEKFNPEYNVRFISYAVYWIKTYMQKAIREKLTGIKFPANKYEDMKKDEWQFISLDKKIRHEGKDVPLISLIEDTKYENPEERFHKKESNLELKQALSSLKEKQRNVITKRYGLDGKEPMSLTEIGNEMGYSKERIRQIELQAINSLKNRFKENSYHQLVI